MLDQSVIRSVELSSIIDLPYTTFQIVQSSVLIEDGYLVRQDVEPTLVQNQEGVFILSIHNQGEFGKFDVPYIGHSLIYADESLVVILAAYHGTEAYGRKSNKRVTKGQFYRFFECDDNGVWCRVGWKQLEEETRKVVLAVCEEHAPAWAKVPGKLEADYATPSRTHVKTISYKLVQVRDGRYYSVYKPEEEYELGKLKVQQAKKHHGGGYFSYPDLEKLLQLFHDHTLFGYSAYKEPMTLALMEVEISGHIIEYSNSKWASTYLRPLQVLSTIDYSPN